MDQYREFVRKYIISSAPYMDEMVQHAESNAIRPLAETIQQKSGSGFSELLASPFWRNYRTYVCPCCGAELSFSPLFGSAIKNPAYAGGLYPVFDRSGYYFVPSSYTQGDLLRMVERKHLMWCCKQCRHAISRKRRKTQTPAVLSWWYVRSFVYMEFVKQNAVVCNCRNGCFIWGCTDAENALEYSETVRRICDRNLPFERKKQEVRALQLEDRIVHLEDQIHTVSSSGGRLYLQEKLADQYRMMSVVWRELNSVIA